ncbi:hypothetical protein [Sporolactobacillus terrae]|uniref:hypothetical protein n=1 Tax=Sporolactobacillus terrae TaxID=269673 RepID=UPI0012DE72DD|nr:hypothetical protein [Sporolactobacillus terrae]
MIKVYINLIDTNNGKRIGIDAEEIGESLFYSDDNNAIDQKIKKLSKEMNIPLYQDGKDYMIY